MSRASVIMLGLDACDPGIVRKLAAGGQLPALAGLMESSARCRVRNPCGIFVGALWVTLTTGLRADRHGFHCWDEIDLDTYLRRMVTPSLGEGAPFWQAIGDAGKCIGRKTQAFAPEVTAYLLHFINAVGGHGQVMFRRELVLGLGGYREEFNLSEDYDLWARLSHLGKIVTLPVVGMKHRRHAESVSARFWRDQEHQARRVSAWMMAELLGRGLSQEEEQALGALWRDACTSAPASRTHAILWEAYRHFTRRGAGFGKRHNVRYEMAHRWCSSGLNLAGRGLIARAAAHVGYGMRWHPGIVFGGGGYVARLVGRKLRALQPASDLGVADRIIDPGSAEESGPRLRRLSAGVACVRLRDRAAGRRIAQHARLTS